MTDANRPTWTEINLENLAFNFRNVKKFVGANLKFMAVVKADGYGHGATECARKLEREGIDWFGVALPEEGLELRENGIEKPILCLGSFWAGQENLLLENDLTPVIYRLDTAEKFNRAAQEKKIIADVHIKIDTGMGRIGVRFDEVKDFADSLKKFANLRVDGIMTHFATADNLGENDFTNEQIKRFDQAAAIFEEKGFRPRYKDLANSPAAVAHQNSRGNLVRIGGILYGLGDDVLPKEIEKPPLKPVLSLHTRIAHLKKVPAGETLGYSRTFTTKKDSLIATIPIGYQDGLTRRLSNKGRVLINGSFAPVVGRISMDWTILDVTNVPNIKVNDEVILIGEQNKEKITAEELASLTETISYEITCGINRRVTRKYVGS
ncbi:MAG: alanine racemase [Acidobacteriota bacterium]|nr:alanine racemase [Acidobacteriota bacterium]